MAGNFWEQDELVTPAPAAPAAAAPGVQPASPAPAPTVAPAEPVMAASGVTAGRPSAPTAPVAATKNFWDDDEIVTPAPKAASPAPATAAAATPLADTKPQRSTLGELGHQAGLTARAAINGAAALPAMAADALIVAPANAALSAYDKYRAPTLSETITGKQPGFRFKPQAQALNDTMTNAGVAVPETATERVVQDATSAMSGAGASMALGKALIKTGGPLTQAVGTMLTQGPKMQLVSAASSGAAAGGVREAGGGAGAQLAAGVAGAMLPGVATAPFRTVVDPNKAQFAASARQANDAGFVIPPADLSDSVVAQVGNAFSGKVKTAQTASHQNQSRSNLLAKQALGMPEDQVLDSASLAALRNDASKAYAPVANAGTVVPTQKYADALDDAVSVFSSQQKSFPGMPVPPAVAQIQALKSPQFDAGDALNVIRGLREAAGAMEDAIEDHLVGMGAPAADVLKQYRDARQLIAKTHSVEQALNPVTGNVNAIQLAAMLRKGKPLTDELRTIAEVGQAFPKAMQPLREAPGQSSIIDIAGALGGVAAGHPMALAGVAARPATRKALLSPAAQKHYVGKADQVSEGAPQGSRAIALGEAMRAAQTRKQQEQSPPYIELRGMVQPDGIKPLNRFQAARQGYKDGGLIEAVPTSDAGQQKPMNRIQAARRAFKDGGVVEKIDGGFVVRSQPAAPEGSAPPAIESVANEQNAAPGPQAAPAAPQDQAFGAVEGDAAAAVGVPGAGAADLETVGVVDPAHDAATSPLNDLPEPTAKQQAAGNYRVGRIKIAGMDISIENPEGSMRRGVDADGTPWETEMAGAHYGYLRRTHANDGEKLDVFVKVGTPSDYRGPVYVIDQVDPETGRFDEHKAIIGAADEEEAEDIYSANYAPDWLGLGAITKLPLAAFKAWAKSGKLKEPLGDLDGSMPATTDQL